MNDIRVVIDAGHGGTDPGAVANGVREKDLTLMISQYMLERFRQEGIPATLIRTSDETISPDERVRRILAAYGNNPNVVVISNHINSTATPNSAEGAEVIYALRNTNTLAKNILEELGKEGQVMRGIYQRRLPSDSSKDYYFIHRNTGVTQPVIVEYGFINNIKDLNKIQQNYKNYVNAVVRAVMKTFELGPGIGENITYTVENGDTLWSIAQKYNTTLDVLRELNNIYSNVLLVGQIIKLPSAPTDVETVNFRYTVQNGDTLWSLAQKYNTTVNEIKRLNDLTNDEIIVGQVLVIPTTGMYIVRPGDTLWNIAQKYNTTVNTIKRLNNLNDDFITVGQVLKI